MIARRRRAVACAPMAADSSRLRRFPNCRMTSTQVRDWSKALGVYGCAMTLWKYDASFLSKAANLDAIRDVAATLNSKARRSCKRS